MVLPPPSIKTRGEFDTELREAIYLADQALKTNPNWPAMRVIRNQLQFMQDWTNAGRTPTEDERKKIQIGLIAVRELEDSEPIADYCHRLNYFFEVWPLAKGQ